MGLVVARIPAFLKTPDPLASTRLTEAGSAWRVAQ